MMKDLMSKTHRENNLDNANIDKALRAAEQQYPIHREDPAAERACFFIA